MENTFAREPLNGLDFCVGGLEDGNETAVDEIAIHADGARAAFALAASLLGAGQVQVFPEHVEQALHGRSGDGEIYAVDVQLDGCGRAHTVAGSSTFGVMLNFANRSSGSRGMELKLTPMASRIALRIAGAGPSWGNSPIPLAPKPPCSKGSSSQKTWIGGTSSAVGMM